MLELEHDGAQLVTRVLPPDEVDELLQVLQAHDVGRPGVRLSNLDGFQHWLGAEGIVTRIAAKWLGSKAAPVRAILFDKNETSNWALGWHQDRTIAVEKRADVHGFENWNRKYGVDHVEPPFDLIERMLTVRVHLDAVSADNAPLLISPGSHRLGRIRDGAVDDAVQRHGVCACLAEAGDIWVYRTAILHASKRASSPRRRRVLQVDYSSDNLPNPLRWQLNGST